MAIETKAGEFKLGKIGFYVPGGMLREVDEKKSKRMAMLANGSEADLAEIQGECVFKLDEIRIQQLGWLVLRRYVQYMIADVKGGLVAVHVG